MKFKENTSLFLREKDLIRVKEIFKNILPTATVIAYGSRVKGDAHDGSDLDLAIQSRDGKEIPLADLSKLRESFEASHIPILVDLHDWARIPESFQESIARECVKIEL